MTNIKKLKKIRSEHNPNLNEDDVALVIGHPSVRKTHPSGQVRLI